MLNAAPTPTTPNKDILRHVVKMSATAIVSAFGVEMVKWGVSILKDKYGKKKETKQ